MEENVEQSFYTQYEDNLCKKCNTRRIDNSENPESMLCRECREELIKLKIPIGIIITGIMVLILVGLSFIPFASNAKKYASYAGAKSLAREGYVVTSLDNLVELLDEYPDNKGLAIRLADLGMKYSYYDYAAYAIDNFLVGKDVSDGEYKRLTGYIEDLDAYYATYDMAEQAITQISGEAAEEDYDKVTELYCNEISSYLGDSNYDESLIYYFLAMAAAGQNEYVDYLNKCIDLNPNNFAANAMLAVNYRREGDLEKSRELLNNCYSINKEDFSVLRAFATLELAEGKLAEGLTFAADAYELYPEGEYAADTYIVALAANGKTQEAQDLLSEWENKDYIFDDDLYAYMDGTITLTDYYIGE